MLKLTIIVSCYGRRTWESILLKNKNNNCFNSHKSMRSKIKGTLFHSGGPRWTGQTLQTHSSQDQTGDQKNL